MWPEDSKIKGKKLQERRDFYYSNLLQTADQKTQKLLQMRFLFALSMTHICSAARQPQGGTFVLFAQHKERKMSMKDQDWTLKPQVYSQVRLKCH